MSHHNTLFPLAAENSETVDFSYAILNRRQFLLRTAVLGATSLLVLPRKLTATSLLFATESRSRPPVLLKNSIGFNGQRRDLVTGLYHLGQGYRAYNPQIMRFHAADNLSPFGAGGFNPYAYALGDPINLIDPTGHISWKVIIGFALGIMGATVSGLILTLNIFITLPALIMGSAIVSLSAGLLAIVLGIISIATEETNPALSETLGEASLFFGFTSFMIPARYLL